MKNVSLFLYSENLFKLVSAFAAVIVASRFYGVDDFGKISYLGSFVVIANAIAESGFGQLNLTKYQIFKNHKFPISSLFVLRLASTALVIILFIVISFFWPLGHHERFILSLSILISLFGFFNLLRQDLIDKSKIKCLIIAGVSSSAITVLLKTLSSIIKITPVYYILVSSVCIFLTGLTYLIAFSFAQPKFNKSLLSQLKLNQRWKNASSLYSLRFSIKNLKPFYLASLAGVLFTYSDILILKLYNDFETIAFYSLSQQFCGAVISFAPSIVSIYASKQLLTRNINSPPDCQSSVNITQRSLRNTLLITSIIFSLCGFFSLYLINILLLKSNYNISVYYFVLSFPIIVFTFLQQGLCLLLQKLRLENFIYIISVSALAFNIVTNIIIIPILGAVGAILSTMIALIFSLSIPLVFRSSRSKFLNVLALYSS